MNIHLPMKKMEIISAYWTQILALKWIKFILSGIILTGSFLIWEINLAIIACCILYMTDLFLWFGMAVYNWKFSWLKLQKGIVKFILYWTAMIVWHMVDLIILHDTVEYGAQNLIVIYLGITEALSVLHHLSKCGLAIPMKLMASLEWIKTNLDTAWSPPLTISALITTETSTSVSPTQIPVQQIES